MARIEQEIEQNGGEFEEPEAFKGSVGRSTFDLPNSKDNLLSVLVRPEDLDKLPSQALVEIRSREDGDGRTYQGIVVEGPFHEPDGLRADAPLIVTTTVRGAMFMLRYHGRVLIEVLGEVAKDRLIPPRHRPLPNSPVFALGDEVTAQVLGIAGDEHDVVMGTVIGHNALEVRFPTSKKAVLPRHTGVLGTTGGGKSTTVSNQVNELQQAGVAVVLVDTEGEYACINEPTEDEDMLAALERRGKVPSGVQNTRLYHLVGREPSNPAHPNRVAFSIPFEELSPDAVMEILELTPAQQDAYQKAYEITRTLIMSLGIYGTNDKEKQVLMELDELERGFPEMELSMVRDVVEVCAKVVAGEKDDDDKPAIRRFYSPAFAKEQGRVFSAIQQAAPKNAQRRTLRATSGAGSRCSGRSTGFSVSASSTTEGDAAQLRRADGAGAGIHHRPRRHRLAPGEQPRHRGAAARGAGAAER